MVATLIREAPARYGREEGRTDYASDRTSGQQRATSDQQLPSEATLTRLWAGQRFPASALVTRQGVPVRVLHPGRRGRGAGPDFRDALIATPSGGLLSGDVELHVRATDFHAHGHDRDRRYDGVVLHFVFDADVAEDTLLASGRRAPVVSLAPWLRRRREELAGWLAHPSLWREPCHDAIARLGREEVLRSLEELGDRRFREREAALAASLRTEGAGEALYRALQAGLGYGGERERFEAVAAALPWRELTALLAASPDAERGLLAEALLLGTAGLLPSQRGEMPRHPHELELEGRWCALGRASPPAGSPKSPVATRPANHPARRLAGLAQLLARHGANSEGLALPPETLDGPASQLVAGWTAPAGSYWQQHVAPGVAAGRPPGALIGRGRAVELLVNAVLPWAVALAEAEGDGERATRVRACFARLPRPGSYGALAFLEANLEADGRRLPLDARRHQGLLALYKTECTQGGCGRCPLS